MNIILRFIEFSPNIPLDRSETEQQIFTKYFNIVDRNMIRRYIDGIPETVKNTLTSELLRNIGNELYREKKYDEALRAYTDSMLQAPVYSVEFGLSLANRSAALFDVERYKECLVDIKRVFKAEYHKSKLYKIYFRQTKCYAALKYHRQASEAIQNAKSHFEIAKVIMKKDYIDAFADKISAIEKSLANVAATGQRVDTEEESGLPALTDGENPQFAYASNRLAMKQNRQRGRHVVAHADIKEGDVLFVEEPYSTGACKVITERLVYCSGCFTSTLTCIPCTFCTNVVFCSDECREQYWNSTHRWLCAGARRCLITEEFNLALGVLFRASHTGFQTAISDEQVFGNKRENYPYVNLLMTHKSDIPLDVYNNYVKVTTFLVIYLIHFTDYFEWLYSQADRPAGTREELYRIVGGTLLAILCRNQFNSDIVTDKCVILQNKLNIELSDNIVSSAQYVSSALMNHSCLPNAVCSYQGNVKIVRALTDIGKETEVTVSYLKFPNIADVDYRRKELQSRYYFLCTCRACTEQSSLLPWLCPRCRGRALTSSDDRTAKCQECQHEFPLIAYRMMETQAFAMANMNVVTNNISIFKKCADTWNKIYHATNWKLTQSYLPFIIYYSVRGDYKNCLVYQELSVNLYKIVYGNSANENNVIMLLKHCLTLMNYCLLLKYQKLRLYRKYLTRTMEAISNTAQLLKYHMSKESADIYHRDMLRILNAGDPDFDAAPIYYHYNAIYSE